MKMMTILMVACAVLFLSPPVRAIHDGDAESGVRLAPTTESSFYYYRRRILIILTPRTLPALTTTLPTTARPLVPAPAPVPSVVPPAPVPTVVPPAPTLPPVG